jgi:hypothetical protein
MSLPSGGGVPHVRWGRTNGERGDDRAALSGERFLDCYFHVAARQYPGNKEPPDLPLRLKIQVNDDDRSAQIVKSIRRGNCYRTR